MPDSMEGKDTIEHSGVIQSVSGTQVDVLIETHPSCASCMASGVCEVSEKSEKLITTFSDRVVKPGDRVLIMMEKSLGFRALFLGYLLPFILVISSLIILSVLSFPELATGLLSLGILIPYYTGLYLAREQIGKKFSFIIKNQNK